MTRDPYENYERTRFRPDARRNAVWTEIIRHLERRLGAPKAMLDIGSGFCHSINASSAHDRYALDLRPEAARHAAPGVQAHTGPCNDLSWLASESCDWVLASNLFEHLPRLVLDETLNEIRRVLRSNGLLIVIQPNFALAQASYFDVYTHLAESIFTEVSMSDYLSSCEFEIQVAQRRFIPFSMKERLPTYAPLVRAYLNSPFKPLAGQMLVAAKEPKTPTPQ